MNKTKHLLQQLRLIVPAPSTAFTQKLATINSLPQKVIIDSDSNHHQSGFFAQITAGSYVVFASVLAAAVMLTMLVTLNQETTALDYSTYTLYELYLDDLYADFSQLSLS